MILQTVYIFMGLFLVILITTLSLFVLSYCDNHFRVFESGRLKGTANQVENNLVRVKNNLIFRLLLHEYVKSYYKIGTINTINNSYTIYVKVIDYSLVRPFSFKWERWSRAVYNFDQALIVLNNTRTDIKTTSQSLEKTK